MEHFATLQFHPVGQGLFGTGCVWTSADACFRWFYDCGTSSKKEVLRKAIERAGHHCCWCKFRHNGCGDHFDLGVISHFDKDHISGITKLLERKKPLKTLLMPYARLDQRLALAFGQTDDVNSDIVRFCANPLTFVQERWNAQRVLIVSGGAGPEAAETPDIEPAATDGEYDLLVPRLDPLDDEYQKSGNIQADILPAGSVLTLRSAQPGCWEFRPYNDQHLANKANAAFRKRLNNGRAKLLQGDSAALSKAKTLYDCTFGRSSSARNEISLFLHGRQVGSTDNRLYECCPGIVSGHQLPNHALSVLYTGDGLLNTNQRYDDLKLTLPLENLVVLQVPHHGSRRAWFSGLGAQLCPAYSVFSADPERRNPGHPHGCVLIDFLHHGPYIVNKQDGFCLLGVAR